MGFSVQDILDQYLPEYNFIDINTFIQDNWNNKNIEVASFVLNHPKYKQTYENFYYFLHHDCGSKEILEYKSILFKEYNFFI